MFNVGGPEIVLVILVALVVLGPEQLPKAMRTFGNVMGEVRKLSSGFQNEMRDVMKAAELDGFGSTDTSKPSGTATGSAGRPATEAATRSAPDGVEEVVARNDGAGSGPQEQGREQGNGSPPNPGTGQNGPSSADRAAG